MQHKKVVYMVLLDLIVHMTSINVCVGIRVLQNKYRIGIIHKVPSLYVSFYGENEQK